MVVKGKHLVSKFANFFLKSLLRFFFAILFLLKKREEDENIQKVISLYKGEDFVSLFTKIRFWDAPFIEVEKIVPKKGLIVDLGCGEGIFTNFLGVASPQRKVIGIEIDTERLQQAGRGVSNVSFQRGDATRVVPLRCDAIVLFHLLHHLHLHSDQELVIKNCLHSLKKSGKLIVVEVDKKSTFKCLVSWLTDCFIVPWLFERRFYTPVRYRNRYEWARLIESFGHSCTITSAEKNKPFTHIIITSS